MKFIFQNFRLNKLAVIAFIMVQLIITVKTDKLNASDSRDELFTVIKNLKVNYKKLKSIIEEAGGKVDGVKLGFIDKNNRILLATKDIEVSNQ